MGRSIIAGETGFGKNLRIYLDSICLSVEYFRTGKDREGLDEFLSGLKYIRQIIDRYRNEESKTGMVTKLTEAIKLLYLCIQNRDITGMADIIEFKLCPLAEQMLEECVGK